MKIRTSPTRRLRLVTLWVCLAVLVGTAGYFGYKFFTRSANPIPSSISSKLTFSPLVIPKNDQQYTTDRYNFFTPEGQTPTLTYNIHLRNGTTIVVSQYTQPSEFNEIPDYKSHFIAGIFKQANDLSTSNGTLYTGQSSKLNAQLGIMIEKGLIVFMFPNQSIDDATWRQLSDHLVVQN